MNPTAIQQMTAEHQLIATVVQAIQQADTAFESQQLLDTQKLRGVVEFLQIYADHRHHQREEVAFFPLLVKRGVPPQGCPIGGLNHDHTKGRAIVATLAEQIEAYEQKRQDSAPALRQTLRDLAKLYQHHLWMEDNMVFPMAEKLVSSEDNQELLTQFDNIDRPLGAKTVAKLEQFAQSLADNHALIA